ncbi:hypothetical protein DACRYDRAFT_113725 [Dacryopinax primogenitus]|uniref:Uncharacterized protein n=1 Tax=Dacryopinax primogenitus (strain DJM 731) TaxID=1858805 RepID=M5GET6_DACPD|nr:uncharacterized protein DACRYDRAFT_113725 [Dacryopinax primogenitus]EJU05667.1 hypothetical protein DACRYDRAFT_113725 [Dacryopinax primogenitus]
MYTLGSSRAHIRPGVKHGVSMFYVGQAWQVAISITGDVVSHPTHPSIVDSQGQPVPPITWSFPHAGSGPTGWISLQGTPQFWVGDNTSLLVLASWDVRVLHPFDTISGILPKAFSTLTFTYRLTFRVDGTVEATRILGSSRPIALTERLACFAGKNGQPWVHVVTIDGLQAAIAQDALHGTFYGAFIEPERQLILLTTECDEVCVYDYEKLIQACTSPPANTQSLVTEQRRAEKVRIRSSEGYQEACIPHQVWFLSHPDSTLVMAMRRDKDIKLFVLQPGSDSLPSSWAHLPIADDEYINSLCLSPDGCSLIYLLRQEGNEPRTVLRVARLPSFPATHSTKRTARCSDPRDVCVSDDTNGDIFRHCNNMHAMSLPNNSSGCRVLLGIQETKLWLELDLKIDISRDVTPNVPVPPELALVNIPLPSEHDVQETLRLWALTAAGGVIEEAMFQQSLNTGTIPSAMIEQQEVTLPTWTSGVDRRA